MLGELDNPTSEAKEGFRPILILNLDGNKF